MDFEITSALGSTYYNRYQLRINYPLCPLALALWQYLSVSDLFHELFTNSSNKA